MSHANIDIENNDRFVWYVCDECRGEVKPFDPVCPHCAAILYWGSIFLWYRDEQEGSGNNG